ncbi:glycosyltransferase family 4 protein [Marinobacter sp. 2_MG-2023]|uniref:glycosyltransferase family 4 protein n=1 Tax=Marinobacter sp. 2_MG-2023 TaxID=3062679 RepID=UPI0026E44382|nr:glycosyltransferase family 4 protein [Marinobacter sp. 2_MG-2023]MDO6443706.1 glycosyltransferase family 4 protein [Marinobacter sp. 2_MG-2023]
MQKKNIVFIVNTPEFFLSHRLPLAKAAKEAGWSVVIVSGSGLAGEKIKALGFTHYEVPIARSGQNPFRELWTLLCIVRLLLRLQPRLVHLITIKPVLYGGIAARITGVRSVVAAISGLGTVFHSSSDGGYLRRMLVKILYRAAFKQVRLRVIFQNSDDKNALLQAQAMRISEARMIKGSGVDLQEYPVVPEPGEIPVVVMAARLLSDKGVFEFVRAAEILKNERGVGVEFRLIGSLDPGNPTSATEDDLAKWKRGKAIRVLGYRADIADQYGAANIVCLPSYYGEGLPKSLVEAAACGRAVVTTDHPGCRDAIKPGESGILVPVRDSVALADAIQLLLESPDLRAQMGRRGRKLAEEEFTIEKIVDQHMKIYEELLAT